MGIFGLLQSLFIRQPTQVPFAKLPLAAFAQTGMFTFFVAHAVAPAASHPSQVPVSRLQIGVWGVVHWVSMRQPTHIPFIKVAVAVVTQTGLVVSFVAHALESAHAWQVPVDVLQMGARGVQSWFVRQPTHIPAIGPASPGTQSGVPPSSRLAQAAVFSALQPRQFPASTSQMGVFPVHPALAQVNGAPPVPLAPAAPPWPPMPPRPPAPPAPPSTSQRLVVRLHVPASQPFD